jgi:hypothetical protein
MLPTCLRRNLAAGCWSIVHPPGALRFLSRLRGMKYHEKWLRWTRLFASAAVPAAERGKAMKNEGTADRVIRVVIGIAVLSLLWLLHGSAHWFGLIGLIPLLTGLLGVCPMYSLLGIRTCPLEQSNK